MAFDNHKKPTKHKKTFHEVRPKEKTFHKTKKKMKTK